MSTEILTLIAALPLVAAGAWLTALLAAAIAATPPTRPRPTPRHALTSRPHPLRVRDLPDRAAWTRLTAAVTT